MIRSLKVEHLQYTQLYQQPPSSSVSNIPTAFFYPIITQHNICHTLDSFEPYPEECRVLIPDLSNSDNAKNLQHLNKYWRRVDQFVREQFAGWRERQEFLQRVEGGLDKGSEMGSETGSGGSSRIRGLA